jgi:Icc-related predicted phosphoesterase
MYREFLSNCSNEFPHVIYIAGNHEFYHGKWKRTLEVLREECQVFNNVYFLDNETKVINDVTFIGGTLWTDLNKGDPITMSMIKNMMNDYRQVVNEDTGYHYLSPATTFAKHRQTVEFIKKTVETEQTKTYVVVGHHAPSPLSIGYKYKGDTIMNGGYVSDLSELILDHPQIKLWIHGHTHDCFDYMIGETRIVCNPRGYYGYEQRANEFSPKLVEV